MSQRRSAVRWLARAGVLGVAVPLLLSPSARMNAEAQRASTVPAEINISQDLQHRLDSAPEGQVNQAHAMAVTCRVPDSPLHVMP
jgi:hypothetical protein